MYTWIERRKVNPERLQETIQRAQSEFFPKLQRAPGFTGFHLVADEANGINTAIIVWESKTQADAFSEENSGWMRTLEKFGHTLQSDNRGETVINLEPQR
jgi:heme-degrading monooxygenase HmoA